MNNRNERTEMQNSVHQRPRRPEVRYGKPAVRVNNNPKYKTTVNTNKNTKEETKTPSVTEEVVQPVSEELESSPDKKNKSSFGMKVLKGFGNLFLGAWNTVTGFEKNNVRSVKADNTGVRVPVARIILCVFLVVLLMFVIIDYVKIFENNQMISELKVMLEDYAEEEKKLTAELDEQFDIVKVSEMANSSLGMVSGENHKKVYVDVSEDDTIEGFEVETKDYGAIATIMNALGESAQAWIDAVKGAVGGNN